VAFFVIAVGVPRIPVDKYDTESVRSRVQFVLVVQLCQSTHSVDTTSSSPPRRKPLSAPPLKDKLGWFLTEPTKKLLRCSEVVTLTMRSLSSVFDPPPMKVNTESESISRKIYAACGNARSF
jgi:hypothetical protein